MMKKLLLMLLLVVGGVKVANADTGTVLHLMSNLNVTQNGEWIGEDNNNTYLFIYHQEGDQEVYEYTVTSSQLETLNGGDLYFRPNFWDDWGQRQPNSGQNEVYYFSDNGQWETKENKYQGVNGAFEIPHSSIKASSYKITVYRKLNEGCWIKVEIVSMPAIIGTHGYATFSCNRALDLSGSDICAYRAMEENGSNGYTVKLYSVTGKVAAGTGLLLKGTENQTTNLTIPVVPTDDSEVTATYKEYTNNRLVATVSEATVTPQSLSSDYYYFLSYTDSYGIGFYSLTAGTPYTSGAGKAYLRTSNPLRKENESSARVSWVFDDDTTTGIDVLKSDNQGNEVYNLNGQRVNNAVRGLYIVNGKKVIMK